MRADVQADRCPLHVVAALALAVMPLPLGCIPAPASLPLTASSHDDATDKAGVRSVDLGRLGPDDVPAHTFQVRNTTSRSIRITAVEKSCGCQTVGVREGDSIPAGGSLDVSYALPADRPGPVGGQLTIRTDAESADLAAIRFSLSATIPRRVWAEPGTLRLSRGTGGIAALVIRADLPGMLERYSHVDTVRGHVLIDSIEPAYRSDGTVEQLNLAAHLSPACPEGLVSDYLSVHFDDPRTPQIDLLVRADGSPPQTASRPSSAPHNAESAP
jgi:hypothetical protein